MEELELAAEWDFLLPLLGIQLLRSSTPLGVVSRSSPLMTPHLLRNHEGTNQATQELPVCLVCIYRQLLANNPSWLFLTLYQLGLQCILSPENCQRSHSISFKTVSDSCQGQNYVIQYRKLLIVFPISFMTLRLNFNSNAKISDAKRGYQKSLKILAS